MNIILVSIQTIYYIFIQPDLYIIEIFQQNHGYIVIKSCSVQLVFKQYFP